MTLCPAAQSTKNYLAQRVGPIIIMKGGDSECETHFIENFGMPLSAIFLQRAGIPSVLPTWRELRKVFVKSQLSY
jgi:hypothetical protein